MSIRMKCDSCSKVFSVSDEKAGRRVRCPGCEAVLSVPADEEPASAPRPRKASGPKKKKKSAKSQGPWLFVGIGVGALALIGVVGFLLTRGPDVPVNGDPAVPLANSNGDPSAPPSNPAAANGAATTPAQVAWAVKADPVAPPIEWPESWNAKVDIFGTPSEALFPTSLSPLVADVEGGKEVSGCEVWNLVTGAKLSTFKGKMGPMNPADRRLSPDGKFLLGKSAEKDNFTKLDVWSLESGQFLRQIDTDAANMNLTFADFLPGDRIVTVTTGRQPDNKNVQRLRVVDFKSGNRAFDSGDDNLLDPRNAAFSHGRRYLASPSRSASGELVIYDTQTGQLVAKKSMSGQGTDSVVGVGFSPLGDKIAVALNGYNVSRLVVLDTATGNELQNHHYSASFSNLVPGILYGGPTIDWLPDDKAVLLRGTVAVDLVSGRLVWTLFTAENEYGLDNSYRRLPVPGGFLTISGKLGKAKITRLPFDPASLSLAQSLSTDNSVEALLKPGQKVSLKVTVEKLRFGTPEETQKTLEGTYREILAAAGFELADDQPVLFKVAYSEELGHKFEQFLRGPAGGGAQSIEGTNAHVKLEWSTGTNDSLWKHAYSYAPRVVSMRGEFTAENARKSMFEKLQGVAHGQPLPYYLSTDKKTMLPAAITVVRE